MAARRKTQKPIIAESTTTRLRAQLGPHAAEARAFAFSPDGALAATGSRDKSARLWDVETGACVAVLADHEGWVNSVAFSPDSRLLATASSDKTVRLWDARTGAPRGALRGHKAIVTLVAFSASGALVSWGNDATARVWDARSVAELVVVRRPPQESAGGHLSPDGKHLVAGLPEQGEAEIVALATGAVVARVARTGGNVTAFAFSPDGALAAADAPDHTAGLWEVATGKQVATLRHEATVLDVAFSPGKGRALAVCVDDGTVVLWDVATRAQTKRLAVAGATLGFPTFSPDGETLLTRDDSAVRVWHTSTGALLSTLATGEPNFCAVFSPSGQTIATDAPRSRMTFWDARSGHARATVKVAESPREIIPCPGSADIVATVDWSASVSLWNV